MNQKLLLAVFLGSLTLSAAQAAKTSHSNDDISLKVSLDPEAYRNDVYVIAKLDNKEEPFRFGTNVEKEHPLDTPVSWKAPGEGQVSGMSLFCIKRDGGKSLHKVLRYGQLLGGNTYTAKVTYHPDQLPGDPHEKEGCTIELSHQPTE